MPNKQNSNSVGLRYCEEQSLGVLPGAPVWHVQEPNSYSDFGPNLTTKARDPINDSRSRRKANVVSLDASGGYNQDITPVHLERLIQSFMFAAAREQVSTAKLNGAAITITGATATTFTAAAGLDAFQVNDLVLSSNFGVPANNKLNLLSAAAAGAVTTAGLTVEAAPPANARLDKVGYQFAAADVAMTVVNGQAVFTSTAGGLAAKLAGLIPGQWVFLGGDAAATQFAVSQGFARVGSISATQIVFDKTDWIPQAEAGAGKTIQLFWGSCVINESTPALITRRSVQLERTLGNDGNGTQSEYLVGAVANKLTLNIPKEDKCTSDLEFVAIDHETRTGTQGVKAGTRNTLPSFDAFNTASDFSRIKIASVSSSNSNPTPLVAFVTDINIEIDNGVTVDKAVGKLAGFDTSVGNFNASGKFTAYFGDIGSIQAIRNNSDVTIDIAMVKMVNGVTQGMLVDLPLVNLGGGRLNVEKDKAIMMPIDGMAAQSSFGHTLLIEHFKYLPALADR